MTTTAKLKSGEVKKALTTVDKGVKIANGATSLTNKLKQLKVTVASDYQEYQQLSDDVKAQLKVKDGNYSADVLKRCAAINWDKKPYLKPLKPKVKQLLLAAKKAKTKMKVSAADAKRAAALRRSIAAAKNKWDMDTLAEVPDWFILALFADDSDVDDVAERLDEEYDDQTGESDDYSRGDDQTIDSSDDTNDTDEDSADNDWNDQDTDSNDDSDNNSDADSASDFSEDDEDSNSDYDDDSENQSDSDDGADTDSESDDDDGGDYDTDDQYDDDADYDDAESLLDLVPSQPSVVDRLFA